MSLQTQLFPPKSTGWKPPNLNELPSWAEAKRIGFDTETCDPELKKTGPGVRRNGRVVGISFCIEDHQPFYLPFGHLGGGNLNPDHVMRYIGDNAKAFNGILTGANLGYDMDYMLEMNVDFTHCEWRDVQVADPLIYELYNSYSLQAISERRGLPGKDEELLREAAKHFGIDPKSDMWKLHSEYVGPYAEQDALLPLRLLRRQEKEIDDLDLWDIFKLECELQPALVQMRRWGVRIDQDRLAQIERWTLEQETEALKEVHRRTGVRIKVGDVWKPDVIAPALQQQGIVLTKTKGTKKDSITKTILEHAGEVGQLLGNARKVNKLRTTFAKSIRTHMVNGRIHTTFNQLRREKEDGEMGGARYGRLSSCDPNLQQQPSPDKDPEFAGEWRKIYIPDDDSQEWVCFDYSQQEPRWLTHYAELTDCKGAHEAAERYRENPDTDNHDMMTRIINGDQTVDAWIEGDYLKYKTERGDCKQIYLGLCYGMGGAKLARKLGLPTQLRRNKRTGYEWEGAGEEAQAKLDKFDINAPYVSEIAAKCEAKAKREGVILTVLGRRCHFPKSDKGGYDWCHKALNRLIQGGSGDQAKQALVDLYKAGLLPQLQVHDEFDRGCEKGDKKIREAIMQIMLDAVACNVPHKVDMESGPSWGEIK